ncbi:hypothetical protein [Lysinibacillus sp. NPDC086135]|uniref:hypothetical protein n=1 Tax=Lysinibacillus sp. NPDC086135 TaxID=3364130 RepID=UPI0037FBA944
MSIFLIILIYIFTVLWARYEVRRNLIKEGLKAELNDVLFVMMPFVNIGVAIGAMVNNNELPIFSKKFFNIK